MTLRGQEIGMHMKINQKVNQYVLRSVIITICQNRTPGAFYWKKGKYTVIFSEIT